MALIPRLPLPKDLAGPWLLAADGAGLCRLSLELDSKGEGRLSVPRTCKLAGVDLRTVAGWRPATDGLALVTEDRSLVLFLDRVAPDTYTARLSDGSGIRLSRAPSPGLDEPAPKGGGS